ncbi:MAG: hypothetical protein CME21_08975 [Gemmatimonadetes bacterium]|nr:hypothetical protein [Gemmatimonadota bacterium]HCK10576.1 hypothetical protein [Candidatus Latescibacterota bacterium]
MIFRKSKENGQPGLISWLPIFFVLAWGTVKADSVRGVWVVRHDMATPASVATVVETAKNAGMNTLFVQVRGRGDAYYRSDLVPLAEDVESGFDPLAACLKLANRQGINVHAWINVYLTWYPDRPAPPEHVLHSHPEWFMISNDGVDMGQLQDGMDLKSRGVEGRYMSPSNPEVQRYLLSVIKELVSRYQVKGIHLDYVRYPNEHYDYSPLAQAGFWTDAALEPPKSESEDKTRAVWNRWRSAQVTSFVHRVKQVVQKTRKGTLLSAAVKPDRGMAYTRYGQNWLHWVNRNYLDFAIPMFYTGSTQSIRARMDDVRKYVQRGQVLAGIGAWNQKTADTLDQIDASLKARLSGFCLFSYTTLAESSDLQELLVRRFGESK